MAKEAYVYKLEYEMENSTWQAYIAAFSESEATEKLYKGSKKAIKTINSITQVCILDAVSKNLKNDICFESAKVISDLRQEVETLRKAKDLRTISRK